MKARDQDTLTVVAPVRLEDRPHLEALLQEAGCRALCQAEAADGWEAECRFRFRAMQGLHFARIAIVEPHREPALVGLAPPPDLLFSSQFDGDLEDHMAELVQQCERGLLEVLDCCEGFDGEGGPGGVRIRNYLRRHLVDPAVFYVGAPRRTVGRIRRECDLARHIRNAAGTLGADVDPTEAWHRIREIVGNGHDLPSDPQGDLVDWEDHMRRKKTLWRNLKLAFVLVLLLVVLYVQPLGTLLVLAVLAAVVWLRHLEELDAGELERAEAAVGETRRQRLLDDWNQKLEATEDIWAQNQLTIVSEVKPGRARRWMTRLILAFIRFRANHKFTRGLLHDIRTIHFAHWSRFDRGRRLMFVSNYDGPWGGYLDDFVTHASGALSAIWSNCVGFPTTRLLRWEGAEDGRRFKAWARMDQVMPSVWYSAYPDLTCESINRNSQLVEGLMREQLGLTSRREEAARWLGWI